MDLNRILVLFRDWKVVILSFTGAATFWFFNALNKDYNNQIDYPVEFIFDRDSLVVIDPLPEYVEIDVSGGGWDLFKKSTSFGLDPILITLENPAETRFITRSTLLPIIINQLSQFKINFLFTDTLFIDIDRKVSKKVNLRADSTRISLDGNYRIVTPITLEPDTAVIYGPTSFMDTLTSTITVPVLAEEIDRAFDRFVVLGLPEEYGIRSNPPTVNVMFGVERFDDLTISVNLELLNVPQGSSAYIASPEATVKFIMRQSLKEDLFAEDFKVIVDYDMISKADSTVPAIVVFYPENALEIEVEPDTFKIQYLERP